MKCLLSYCIGLQFMYFGKFLFQANILPSCSVPGLGPLSKLCKLTFNLKWFNQNFLKVHWHLLKFPVG